MEILVDLLWGGLDALQEYIVLDVLTVVKELGMEMGEEGK